MMMVNSNSKKLLSLFFILYFVVFSFATTSTTNTQVTIQPTIKPIQNNCNVYVDSNSNYTASNSNCALNFPCSNIQTSIQSCGTNYNEITLTITPGTYYINTTTFGIITNKVINIINSAFITTSSSGSTSTYNGNNEVIIDLTNAIDSFIRVIPEEQNDYTEIYILGITFQNGKQPSGTVILNQGSLVNITIDQSTFISNEATDIQGGGGTLAMFSGIGNSEGGVGAINSTVSITTSSFINTIIGSGSNSSNSINTLKAPKQSALGGVIFSNSTTLFTIDNCVFTNNTGGTGGIAYIWSGYMVLSNSLIQGSHTTSAFYLNSMSGIGSGEPLFLINNVNFTNSTGGSGFYITGQSSQTTFSNCSFIENVNTVIIELVYSFSNVQIKNCYFFNNDNQQQQQAAGTLIGIYESTLTIESSIFFANKGTFGGAIQMNGSLPQQRVVIYNCEFSLNNATYGGSIFSQDANLLIYNSEFLNNQAVSGSSVYCLNSDITFSNMTFTNNTDTSISTPNGIGCGSGKVCSISGDQQFQDSCSYNYQPAKPSLLSPGEVAAIVICTLIGAAGIATILILIVRKISRRNVYRPIGY